MLLTLWVFSFFFVCLFSSQRTTWHQHYAVAPLRSLKHPVVEQHTTCLSGMPVKLALPPPSFHGNVKQRNRLVQNDFLNLDDHILAVHFVPSPLPRVGRHLMAVECSLMLLSALVLWAVVVIEQSPNKTKMERRLCRHGGITTDQTGKNLFLRYIQATSAKVSETRRVFFYHCWPGSALKRLMGNKRAAQTYKILTILTPLAGHKSVLCVAPPQGAPVW